MGVVILNDDDVEARLRFLQNGEHFGFTSFCDVVTASGASFPTHFYPCFLMPAVNE